ncbi:MAG: hypothetical protein ACI8ZM_002989 [Crocinitomix sp.]|jgi:hypothetical protein
MNNQNKQETGMNCPRCDFKIKFNIQDLLIKNKIDCPGCLLQMDMAVTDQIKSHLQEIKLAQDTVYKARNADL